MGVAIPGGLLRTRILIKRADESEVKRWVYILNSTARNKFTPGAILKSGEVIFKTRYDSFSTSLEIGERFQYDGNWYAITDYDANLEDVTMVIRGVRTK